MAVVVVLVGVTMVILPAWKGGRAEEMVRVWMQS